MKPIIHYYTIVWNEESIIPFVIQYYSHFVDKFIFYVDYGTDDKTEDILKSYSNVEIRHFGNDDGNNEDNILNIKNNAWKESRGKADYVIVCDVDELLYIDNLIENIDNLKDHNISIIKCEGWEMVNRNSDQYPLYDDQEMIISKIQYGVKNPQYFNKTILFDPNKINDINYGPGGHSCKPIGNIVYPFEIWKLLHYKHLSLPYDLQRYKQLNNRRSKSNIIKQYGVHYDITDREIINQYNSLINNSIKII